ncbi:tetratricopeptide repeat protein [Lysinibacillus piscis]|uniref:Tetratrico peptide repeat group 5 domain-containing protein n=1 Tax=Lysinibacillus piscis TaxID=2518931 RepID=A0ABQ5NR21_9BACI|nr:tetratricopeptide repeat protein [Lysinibacillus sp. KH24]GLC90469.1 hypothetical protein LYSBPC_35960 [Lysinibacillus sp. KH24]
MDTNLQQILALRKAGKLEEASACMRTLLQTDIHNALYQYQMAWCYDNLGLETEAVPHYEQAIALGLTGEDLQGAYAGLGSTYRALGQYELAEKTLQAAIKQFPNAHYFKVFYAMTLYNLQQHDKAMEYLLTTLAETTNDEGILQYQKAILFYSDKLNQTWD